MSVVVDGLKTKDGTIVMIPTSTVNGLDEQLSEMSGRINALQGGSGSSSSNEDPELVIIDVTELPDNRIDLNTLTMGVPYLVQHLYLEGIGEDTIKGKFFGAYPIHFDAKIFPSQENGGADILGNEEIIITVHKYNMQHINNDGGTPYEYCYVVEGGMFFVLGENNSEHPQVQAE